MKPPMHQTVTVFTPTEETDDFGRPRSFETETKARVERSTRTIRTAQGTLSDVTLEIDLPPEVIVSYGTEISFTDDLGSTRGPVIGIEESRNLSGTKVYFRTVFIG